VKTSHLKHNGSATKERKRTPRKLSVSEGIEQSGAGVQSPHPALGLSRSATGGHQKCEHGILQENENTCSFLSELNELTLNIVKENHQ
jgi:hypothetical protein